MRLMRAALAVSSICLLLTTACQRGDDSQRESGSVNPATDSSALEWGGDAQAWLTNRGSANDAGYVAARLRLPLEREPAWTFSYTAAEFSSQAANQILHYRGSLIVSARSSQFLVLDAATGALTYSDALYSFSPEAQERNEQFVGVFITPRGMLAATDDRGRIYGLDLRAGQLDTRWMQTGADQTAPLVAGPDLVITQGNGVVRSYRASDGDPQWNYPVGSSSFNVTMSQDGILLWCSRRGELRAWDIETGHALWSVQLGIELPRSVTVAIDDHRDVFYVLREDASLECRDLADGGLHWTYSWSHLDAGSPFGSPAERAGAVQNLNVGPDALTLVLLSGDVVMLRPDGTERWHTRLETSLAGGLLFENALLVTQFYARPVTTLPQVEDAYNQVAPPWDNVQRYSHILDLPARTGERQRRFRRGRGNETPTFNRIVALRLEDGTVLDAMEPPLLAASGLTPALDKVVLGGERLLADIAERAESGQQGTGPVPRWIYAYNWLESEQD